MKIHRPRSSFKFGLALAVTLAASVGVLTACGGGGGGGGDFIGAAEVYLDVNPETFDTGDRSEIRASIDQVDENGIFLKFKFPKAVSYVKNSAFLQSDGDDIDVSPSVNRDVGNDTYLVFILARHLFDEGGGGELRFQVEGDQEVTTGTIEVDADVDDPLIANDHEFSAQNPEFGAEDSVDIQVRG